MTNQLVAPLAIIDNEYLYNSLLGLIHRQDFDKHGMASVVFCQSMHSLFSKSSRLMKFRRKTLNPEALKTWDDPMHDAELSAAQ